eukprot:CAMPEP_0171830102 /NCGR_PEP_ID=MMETSP0992-20121227/8053_1 /TAXON_ID=483369 /ORGANISM="non described non described, Strain CCMP2098" /LENGTH=253 /DNA_ID=CAMNT_0012445401 /DNA_START=349 /DNA_END=1108 /DNA_ORIENTATION=+
MPLCFSVRTALQYGHQTCDRNVELYLQGQACISAAFVVLVGVPMWKRINWVGALKDALAESPEIFIYTVAATLWWLEFGWTIFGVRCAAQASACSGGLLYASRTMAGYMMGLGLWIDLVFHIVIPALMHLYSGQPAADILPPGAGHVDGDTASLPPAPQKRKRPPPKRECPKCRHDAIPEELKMCPICGSFVPPLEFFLNKVKQEEDDIEGKGKPAESDKNDFGIAVLHAAATIDLHRQQGGTAFLPPPFIIL